MPKHDIDLGALQTRFANAKRANSTNEKALKRALDLHRKSRKELDDAKGALESASAAVLDN